MYTTPRERWIRRAIALVSLAVSAFVATHVMPCLLGMIVATLFLATLAAIGLGLLLAAVSPGRVTEYSEALGRLTVHSLGSLLRMLAVLLIGTLRQLELDALPYDLRLLMDGLHARAARVRIVPVSRRLRNRNDHND